MAIDLAEELTSPEFASLVGPNAIAVLPLAAIEPHLPLSTDCSSSIRRVCVRLTRWRASIWIDWSGT